MVTTTYSLIYLNRVSNSNDLIVNFQVNSTKRMRYRVVMMIIIRVMYLLSNLGALMGLDNLLLGNYMGYGKNYVSKTMSESNQLHDANLKVIMKSSVLDP